MISSKTTICWSPKISRLFLSPALFYLQTRTDSLTQALKNRYPDFAVVLLTNQGKNPKAPHTWERSVLLTGQQKPIIYAKTQCQKIPHFGPWSFLHAQGTRPLGERLFHQATITRSQVTHSKIPGRHSLIKHLKLPNKLYGIRKTIFYHHSKPIEIIEIFLNLTKS